MLSYECGDDTVLWNHLLTPVRTTTTTTTTTTTVYPTPLSPLLCARWEAHAGHLLQHWVVAHTQTLNINLSHGGLRLRGPSDPPPIPHPLVITHSLRLTPFGST